MIDAHVVAKDLLMRAKAFKPITASRKRRWRWSDWR
jgi:hypothetical protein